MTLSPSAVVDFRPLAGAVKIAASVIEKRCYVSILSNVRLTGFGDHLRLVSTDLDMVTNIRIPAAADLEFDTTIPGHTLNDILRKSKGAAMVALDSAEDAVRIDLGGPSSRIFSISVADWPEFEIKPFSHEFTLPTATLRSALSRVAFAISTEETRYYLNGAFVHLVGGMLAFVATDGHRLASVKIQAPEGLDDLPGSIIPSKTVAEYLKATKGKDAPAETVVRLNAGQIQFEFGNVTMTSKLIDGTFPQYDRVVPLGNDKFLTVLSDEFGAAVKHVSAMASERGRAVKLEIAEHRVTISVNNPDGGTASAACGVVESEGFEEGLDISFNASYLLAFLDVLGDRVRFGMGDRGSPTLIQDPADPSFIGVLMPMRV